MRGNIAQLMQQAQQMQDMMQTKQAELEDTEFPVSTSGGMVEVTIRGDYQVTAVKIKPEIIDPEDIEMLEDMVAAGFNEAVRTVKENTEKEMEKISGEFPGLSALGGM